MPTKEQVLKSIEDRSYYGKEVRHLITSITKNEHEEDKITKVIRGDVFVWKGVSKHRPYVVAKVIDDKALCLGMSSTKNYMNLVPKNCRQFGGGYLNLNMIFVEVSYIKKHFVGQLSDKKSLTEAIKLLKYVTNKI